MSTVWSDELYRALLDRHDLYSILAGMHDSFLRHNVEDNPEVREEINFLIEALKARRKAYTKETK
jgi:hypothetical protein